MAGAGMAGTDRALYVLRTLPRLSPRLQHKQPKRCQTGTLVKTN